ncbi:universal stress protein [Deinococcus sp. SDU3-2]|uniref:Universal stress protein n=1 Tax=Deinococcus terrestris TaxID=2651870 RepID=A0A7X1NXE6_9DEIO|nr:universal stress protein [Deinococcus terrestris]MPY67249.1 universal stress protein [Deinococcus terrestris]
MTEPVFSQGGAGGQPFSRVLVGTDFSAAADHALAVARLRFPGALRRLVHVTDARVTATPDLMGGVTPAALDPTLLHTLESADGERLKALAGPGEEAELLVGDPVTGILDAAEHWGADLIVVGTHSRGALEHFFLGSSAEKLISRSLVPVLTVRLPGDGR